MLFSLKVLVLPLVKNIDEDKTGRLIRGIKQGAGKNVDFESLSKLWVLK